jgi:hypothetical protein
MRSPKRENSVSAPGLFNEKMGLSPLIPVSETLPFYDKKFIPPERTFRFAILGRLWLFQTSARKSLLISEGPEKNIKQSLGWNAL